jgi:hypothetical protein
MNANICLSEDSIFHIFFDSEIAELIQRETKFYGEQQISKKDKISGS